LNYGGGGDFKAARQPDKNKSMLAAWNFPWFDKEWRRDPGSGIRGKQSMMVWWWHLSNYKTPTQCGQRRD